MGAPAEANYDLYRLGHLEKMCFFGPDFLPVCEKAHFVWCPDLYMGWISKRLKTPTVFWGFSALFEL